MTREEWLIQRSIKQAAQDTGLHPGVISQVIQHESSGNPNAQSPTGPQGLMQLGKAAAIEGGIDPAKRLYIPDNIKAGAAYYKQQVDKFGENAYAAYHDGPGAIASGRPVSKEGQWTPDVPPATPTREQWLAARKPAPSPRLTPQEQANIAAYDRTEAVRKIPNFVPHNVLAAAGSAVPLVGFGLGPLLGGGLRAFENSDAGRSLVEHTKDIPYIGPTTKFMLGQGDSKFDIKAGQEASKLLAGAGELKDFVRAILPGDSTAAYKSALDRANLENSNDVAMKELNDNPGVGGYTGAALPYMLTQYALGAPLARGVESVLGKISGIPGAAFSEGKGALTRLIENTAATPGILGDIGAAHVNAFTKPWANAAAARAKQVVLANPYRAGQAGRVAGGIATGMLEGGLHYNNSMGEGMVSGAMGGLGGEVLRPYLMRAPNFNSKPTQDIIDWHASEGGLHSPGVATGSLAQQDFESGIRNTRYLKNSMNLHDQAMNIVNNRIAAKSTGLPNAATVEDFGPTVLRKHLADLGEQYDKLEAGTVAKILPSDHAALANHVSKLLNDVDPEVNQVGRTVQSYAMRIKDTVPNNYPVRDPLTGRLMPQTTDGKTFKGLRKDLKATISAAYGSGNVKKAEALTPVLQMLDDSVERGLLLSSAGKVTITGEPVGIAEWKRLNEQTAMTHLVIDNGLTSSGAHVDTHKLHNFFEHNDAQRFHLESGPEAVTSLHRLAKFGNIFKETSKAALGTQASGGHGFNPGNQSLVQKLLQTGAGDYLPVLPSAAMHLYMKGIGPIQPAVTGWANASGRGFGDPSMYTRSLHQGSQPWPKLYQGAVDAKDKVVDEYDKFNKAVRKSYKDYVK